MRIRPLQPHEHPRWIELRRALFTEDDPAQIVSETIEYFPRRRLDGLPAIVLVAEVEGGTLVGFAEASLRPYARRCATSPVGYLEGWYVEEAHRRRGIGRALVVAAEDWARQQGCSEFASDRAQWNVQSRSAHKALAFEDTDRNEFYYKLLGGGIVPARDFIAITTLDLDAGTITNLVHDDNAGGIAVFLGTTRAETLSDGRELVVLDYEAYEEMALAQLHKLAALARSKWPIVKLALIHHIGRVKLAEPSVIIAVSTPHRAESFEACRFLIDSLKKDVAIWKKEVWADGTGSWIHPDPL